MDITNQMVLKDDCQLFSMLLISYQSRECDLHDVLRHENIPFPTISSGDGKLHTCQKYQLAAVRESSYTS